MEHRKQTAWIAMSGGVDSAVCALLLKKAGLDCRGVTMRLLNNEETEQSVRDAAAVCESLGMAHDTVSYETLFAEQVIEPFARAYREGLTPNPCLACNRSLKFGALLSEARLRGFDCVATGHYARVRYDGERGRYLLCRAADSQKDQSYVLYMLTQEQLSHVRFPLGEMTKAEARAVAEAHGLVNAHKKDSQDICFVPDGDYVSVIDRLAGKPMPCGDFVDTEGRVLGQHRGLYRYTVGQHKGLGLGIHTPLYVQALCPIKNTVVLGPAEGLYARHLVADGVNLIDCESMRDKRRLCAKVRYRHREAPAEAYVDADGLLHVIFDEPVRAITCGQAVVLYDGDVVVGGGRIVEVRSE